MICDKIISNTNLKNINFLGNGIWIYYEKQTLERITINNSFNNLQKFGYSYAYNLLGIYKLNL